MERVVEVSLSLYIEESEPRLFILGPMLLPTVPGGPPSFLGLRDRGVVFTQACVRAVLRWLPEQPALCGIPCMCVHHSLKRQRCGDSTMRLPRGGHWGRDGRGAFSFLV